MDYFTFIVHVFTPQTRAFYSLERLWGDAERLEFSDEPAPLPPEGGELAAESSAWPTRRGFRLQAEDHDTLADSLISLLLAPACAACARRSIEPTRGPVCPACWDAVVPITPPVCDACGDPLPSWRLISVECGRCPRCRRRRSDVARARAIGAYDGALRAIVHALKYDGRRSLAQAAGGADRASRRRRDGRRGPRRAGAAAPLAGHVRAASIRPRRLRATCRFRCRSRCGGSGPRRLRPICRRRSVTRTCARRSPSTPARGRARRGGGAG